MAASSNLAMAGSGMLGCSVLTPEPHGGGTPHIPPHIGQAHYHTHGEHNPVGDHDYTADRPSVVLTLEPSIIRSPGGVGAYL